MPVLIPLFLISLLSISVMFGRKLKLLANRSSMNEDGGAEITLQIPYLAEIKHITRVKIKRFCYLFLVATIRLYFRTSNKLKYKYTELKERIKHLHSINALPGIERQEVSKFLKVVSDYKHKLRKIKHQIREEESGR